MPLPLLPPDPIVMPLPYAVPESGDEPLQDVLRLVDDQDIGGTVNQEVNRRIQEKLQDAMQRVGDRDRSFLGVGVVEIDAERAKALNLREERGVEITRLEENGPAAKGGLKKGDVVLEYNGQRVEGTTQFSRMVRETPANRDVKLLISRNGTQQPLTVRTGGRRDFMSSNNLLGDVNVTVPVMPSFSITMPEIPRVIMAWQSTGLGVEAEPLGQQLAQYFGVKDGLLVRSVTANSAAEKSGLKAGDVITRVEGNAVNNTRDLGSAVRNLEGRKTLNLTVVRDKREMPISMNVENLPARSARPPRARTVTVSGPRI